MSYFFVISQFVLLGCIVFFGEPFEFGYTLPLQIGALGLGIWAVKAKNFRVNPFPDTTEGMEFVQTGPYKYIRHPMYTSLLLFGIAWTVNSWSYPGIAALIGLYIILWNKSKYEEAQMRAAYGEEYDRYYSKVTRFFPGIIP